MDESCTFVNLRAHILYKVVFIFVPLVANVFPCKFQISNIYIKIVIYLKRSSLLWLNYSVLLLGLLIILDWVVYSDVYISDSENASRSVVILRTSCLRFLNVVNVSLNIC
jgi:hypothetical protein